MATVKILAVGSIQGRLTAAFSKISKLHAKHNFTLAVVVGDLFGSPDDETKSGELQALLNGQINVPLPTYFTVGDSAFPEAVKTKLGDGDLCANLYYLGRKGTMNTTDGVRIMYLGGRQAPGIDLPLPQQSDPYGPEFFDSEARGLPSALFVHVLITNQWPANIANGSKIALPAGVDGTSGSQSISNLCQAAKPWYHFSSSPSGLWEREPFKHVVEYATFDEPNVTRFKSLANISMPTKEWMSAFILDTSRPPPTVQPPLMSPFIVRSSPGRKRFAIDGKGASQGGDEPQNAKRARKERRYGPTECFLCINKPGNKNHLVVSLGDESMVTATRGPLPLPETFPQLSFSGHAMIVPFYHAGDESAHGQRSPDELAAEFQEMNKFRRALSLMIGVKSQGQLGAVCWELHRSGIRHLHWQLMACPVNRIKPGVLEAAFKIRAAQCGYPDFQTCPADYPLPHRTNYFRVWTWMAEPVQLADYASGTPRAKKFVGVTESMFFTLQPNQKFNVWFGREVMARLLQLEDRTNWMDSLLCKDGSTDAAEAEDAEDLRADFEEFDFAMKPNDPPEKPNDLPEKSTELTEMPIVFPQKPNDASELFPNPPQKSNIPETPVYIKKEENEFPEKESKDSSEVVVLD
ncbi:hypothetical protein AYL99_09773 [Fonsecaea erecta]|uniref:Cwf19-like C-terminal domain-containing protein n=1 Tax=Fonsecaea erecta TaxID=1367422 RepID=A0A178Z804_9EURO|nr:hypothetical protein AYL99_09773 [Fonsecaea erecta]OAP55621.1 hypothetical protein AYL99_09773 [Fonsecaea erecta]